MVDKAPLKDIQKFLKNNNSNQNLQILSIEGSGGLGKSTLLDKSMTAEILNDYKYLTLKINGIKAQNTNIYDIISDLINSASSQATFTKKPGQLFPNTTNVLREYEKFRNALIAAYTEQDNSLKADEILKCLNFINHVGQAINDISPVTAKFLRIKGIEETLEKMKIFSPEIKILQKEGVNTIQKLTLRSDNINIRNAFRENSTQPLANALLNDLSAILKKPENPWIPAPSKIKGIDRLLLIIDDFEALQDMMNDFLTENLFRLLKNANFESKVIILGRDRLSNTSPNWDQHFQNSLAEPIQLKHLNKDEVFYLATLYGIEDERILKKMWEDTEGYPYYIQLWITEIENGGTTATSLKQFYTRMTRWLSENQKEWLHQIIFLDEINVESVSKLGFSKEESLIITDWFQKEASLRDQHTKKFRFTPFAKSRILEFFKITDPNNFIHSYQKATVINQEIKKLNKTVEAL